MNSRKNQRRRFLLTGIGASAGILTTSFVGKAEEHISGDKCTTTPEQDLGPFYPHVKTGDGDLDLTTVQGKNGVASGEIILVRGHIMDGDCQPIDGALVEIWQANEKGRYSHEGDNNNANPLDPFFEGWGEMLTSDNGEYGFKTIKPGKYQVGPSASDPENWRTPHIHFKVSKRGYHEIVTQMYFSGEELNETDMVLAEVEKEAHARFILTPQTEKSGLPLYNFDVSLAPVKTKQQRKDALNAYCGNYTSNGRGRLSSFAIHEEDGQLYLDMTGYTSVELKPGAKDEFFARPIYLRLVFNKDAQGKVITAVAHDTSSEPSDPRIVKRVG